MSNPPRILIASADVDALFDVDVEDDDGVVADALRAAGAVVAIEHWDDPEVDWGGADAVLVRSVWDYPARRDQFVAWAAAVGAATTLFPDPDIVRWNTHKGYLLELEERGAPVVPTAWLGAGDDVELAEVAADRGWDAVVVKPAVGSGSRGLVVAPDPSAAQAAFAALVADHDVLVQPMLARVATTGELSVVVIDGRCSHAVRKVPAAEDLRVQIEFGGTYEQVEPDEATVRLAEWVVAATAVEPLFARVDLLPADDGTWQLVELELVEPALYVDWGPGSADRLAAALLARLDG